MTSTSSPALRNCESKPFTCLRMPGVERHVAAGDVLGRAVVDHDMRRPAGRKPHAIRDPGTLIGNQIRPADSRVAAAHQRQRQVIEPILIRFAVAVGVDHHLAAGGVHPHVAGMAQAHVLLPDVPHPGKSLQDLLRAVRAAVIDEDHFEIRIAQLLHRPQARFQRAGAVVGADHDAAHRQLHIRRLRNATEHLPHRRERRLGLPVARSSRRTPSPRSDIRAGTSHR